MRIYIASPWVSRETVPAISAQLESLGHTITHKWWLTEDGTDPDYLRKCAEADRDGVIAADLLVVINSAKSEGKAVEQGVAIANDKPIIIVGKRGEISLNVFHYLPIYRWVDDLNGLLDALRTVSWLLKETK